MEDTRSLEGADDSVPTQTHIPPGATATVDPVFVQSGMSTTCSIIQNVSVLIDVLHAPHSATHVLHSVAISTQTTNVAVVHVSMQHLLTAHSRMRR